jgi:hypothetical protein
VAHMKITADTIYESAQRNRGLAHELLYLIRLRDKVQRAEARKARGKFGPRDRRKRVRHALKIRCRLFRGNSSESLLPPQQNAFIESFNGRLRWIEVSSMPGTGASFAAWPATVLLETFDGSHLLSALTVRPGRPSNDNPFSN